ncbi:MAG: hypothetical protein DRI95_09775 [Bacteroidetes bacterium]|nr:MAG: hypothetical protein DRI95_09775 [Bacteroidota bacterium]
MRVVKLRKKLLSNSKKMASLAFAMTFDVFSYFTHLQLLQEVIISNEAKKSFDVSSAIIK